MDPKHKNVLRKNRMAFLDDLDVEGGLTDYLLAEGVFTDAIKEKILLPNQTKIKKNGEFLDTVQKRGPKAYHILYDGLVRFEQFHLADLLKPERAPSEPSLQAGSNPPQSATIGGNPGLYRRISQPVAATDDVDNRLNIDAIPDGQWPSQETLVIEVKPTPPSVLSRLQSKSSHYKMSAYPRGRALIINNEKFQRKLTTRDGTNVDCGNITSLFTQLHFETVVVRNRTSLQIKEILEKERVDDYHKSADCFVLIVLSHGENEAIYGTDEQLITYKELYEPFDGTRCINLKGKPKLFLIQACQGQKKESDRSDGSIKDPDLIELSKEVEALIVSDSGDHSDANPFTSGASLSKADFFFATATFPEYLSWRNEDYGSWFIRAVCEVFQDYACDDDLIELLRKVRNLVAKRRHSQGHRQTTTDKLSTLMKKLYFYPQPRANEQITDIL